MWDFFSEPEVPNYDSPNLGHFLLLNSTKLNVHILKSYRSIFLKLLKCQHQGCLYIENLKKS